MFKFQNTANRTGHRMSQMSLNFWMMILTILSAAGIPAFEIVGLIG